MGREGQDEYRQRASETERMQRNHRGPQDVDRKKMQRLSKMEKKVSLIEID